MDGYNAATYGDRFADVYDDWYGSITDTEACVATVAQLARAVRLWSMAETKNSSGPLEQGDAPPARSSVPASHTPRAARVLELGVGTGRIAIPLAAAGLDVTGIDASSAMLAALKAKPGGPAVTTILGDMADPAAATKPAATNPAATNPAATNLLGESRLLAESRFDVVLIAYNTLFNLVGEGEQERCLSSAANLLTSSGSLLIEAFVPDPGVGRADAVTTRQVTIDRVVLSVSQADPDTQEVLGQYVDISEDGIKLRPWQIRWTTLAQLDAMAERAGLVLAERWSDWDRAAFTAEAHTHVSTYRLA
ncbi:MAG: class I SAM-dependent methyltransferase [Aquihabitans sp.]